MRRYTKIAILATVLASAGTVAYAAKTMENDAMPIIQATQAKIPMTQAMTVAEQHARARRLGPSRNKPKRVGVRRGSDQWHQGV